MDNYWFIDGHCDSLIDYLDGLRSLMNPAEGGQWDLARARSNKQGIQIMAAFIQTKYKPSLATHRGLELVHAANRLIEENKATSFMIYGEKDLQQVYEDDKTGILLSIEGGEILGESLFMLDIIHKLGVRALGLTWNQRNAIGDGAGEKTNSRLTKFGEKVIKRMNELGMIIDVSHLNEAGFWHVLELSDQPIVASHSCAYSLCPHPRNLTDKQLKAIAENKGVVGVNFCPDFLSASSPATLSDVVKHICHIAEVAGIEAVGIGSDFDGIDVTPIGLEDIGSMSKLVEALLHAGFRNEDIKKIMHGNFMRLLLSVLN